MGQHVQGDMSGRWDNLLLHFKLDHNRESIGVHESPWEVEFVERQIVKKVTKQRYHNVIQFIL